MPTPSAIDRTTVGLIDDPVAAPETGAHEAEVVAHPEADLRSEFAERFRPALFGI